MNRVFIGLAILGLVMVPGLVWATEKEPLPWWVIEENPNWFERYIIKFLPGTVEHKDWVNREESGVVKKAVSKAVQEEFSQPENKEWLQGIVQRLILPACLVGLGYISHSVFLVMRMQDYARLVRASSWLAAFLTAFGCMAFILLTPSPAHAAPVKWTDLVGDTFGPGKPGAVVINIIGIGMVDWLGEQLLVTVRRANIAAQVKAATHITGALLLASLGWQLFVLLMKWANISL